MQVIFHLNLCLFPLFLLTKKTRTKNIRRAGFWMLVVHRPTNNSLTNWALIIQRTVLIQTLLPRNRLVRTWNEYFKTNIKIPILQVTEIPLENSWTRCIIWVVTMWCSTIHYKRGSDQSWKHTQVGRIQKESSGRVEII